jgi:hypothetical protein
MSTEGQLPDEERKPVLDKLAAEVEVDLELIARSRSEDAETERPDQWLVDPEEVQLEETDLRSLLGAVETLADDPRHDPGDASPR